jgi:hypothetical protein
MLDRTTTRALEPRSERLASELSAEANARGYTALPNATFEDLDIGT